MATLGEESTNFIGLESQIQDQTSEKYKNSNNSKMWSDMKHSVLYVVRKRYFGRKDDHEIR
jgi:hypothetical protein